MTVSQKMSAAAEELKFAADLAIAARNDSRALDPKVISKTEKTGFDVALSRHGRNTIDVLQNLNDAALPHLTGSTEPGFMGWVIGGSHSTGVAADWLTSAWGQNGCLYECSPAAAMAEEAVSKWLLDLLDLPRESTVGFTTGATMATFTALASARLAVFEKAGHDFEDDGFCGAPPITVYVSDDIHVTNLAVLRYLGFGRKQIRQIPSLEDGTFDLDALSAAMDADCAEARIVIGQAGHIMSGAFDNFTSLSALCKMHHAWLHIDGAFGLWVRASVRLTTLAHNVHLADSWSVDGHKWLQIPYDSGFAIVRHAEYHRRAMTMRAGYLPEEAEIRNNSDYVPELSRRARGFAVWAVMQNLGALGISTMIERHCDAAHQLAGHLRKIEDVKLVNKVCLNQLAVTFSANESDCAEAMAERLNSTNRYFVRTAEWKGRTVLRFSITSWLTNPDHIRHLAAEIERAWIELRDTQG